MWKCISVVAQKAFEMFLSVKAEKVSDVSVGFDKKACCFL